VYLFEILYLDFWIYESKATKCIPDCVCDRTNTYIPRYVERIALSVPPKFMPKKKKRGEKRDQTTKNKTQRVKSQMPLSYSNEHETELAFSLPVVRNPLR
jgi:hypothetical protein